jgi:hypothetical protein
VNGALAQVGRVQKGSCGRRGLPSWFVEDMYEDYQFLGSTYKVARKYGRTAQSVWDTFANRRLAMRPDSRKRRGKTRTFDGMVFTRSNKMGWRATSGDRPTLKHVIF